ncbi:MAG: bifunctional glycosyltransferase family 2/GtrA family protein [Clostridia bacterium]|nr:bifunctional glycosyltransferase family 2/GtrA family protein [Clostridia bacterium]
MLKNIFLVIPSLNPDEKLGKTIADMISAGFNNIIVVDDGSDEDHVRFFPTANNNITLLKHEVNRGKGAALKTAFKYITENFPEADGVVTADGDGQHAPGDVLRCAEEISDKKELILGCRDFSGADIPGRSRFGNKTTSFIFKALCGKAISDTQTGLRGFPACLLKYLCTVKGDRFEYETNMLLKCIGDNIPIREIKIETVYIEENKTSHFRPVRDSVRIYRFLFAYVLSSLCSCAADMLCFIAFLKLFGVWGIVSPVYAPGAATVLARIISSILNYTINKTKVFEHKGHIKKTVFKYYTLAVVQMLVSAAAVTAITYLLGAKTFGSSIIKMAVDTFIFFFSFRIQKLWVFRGE